MDVLNNLEKATGKLKDAHGEVHETALHVTIAKRDLAEAEWLHTMKGLEGKNAEARKAELATLTRDEQASLNNAESRHREAQLRFTFAELDYKFAREAAALHRAELLARAPQAAD